MTNWKLVRLELARCDGYPDGSAAHAYLMRLPLSDSGRIDKQAIAREPAMAAVHRVWPGEPDQQGYLVRKPAGWAFSYALGEDDDENIFHLETHTLRVGDYVTIRETDGQMLPFRIASLNSAKPEATA